MTAVGASLNTESTSACSIGFLAKSASLCSGLGWLNGNTSYYRLAVSGMDSIWIANKGGNGVACAGETEGLG